MVWYSKFFKILMNKSDQRFFGEVLLLPYFVKYYAILTHIAEGVCLLLHIKSCNRLKECVTNS